MGNASEIVTTFLDKRFEVVDFAGGLGIAKALPDVGQPPTDGGQCATKVVVKVGRQPPALGFLRTDYAGNILLLPTKPGLGVKPDREGQ
jgi:hypothetical protein